jgi:S-methylmethionine-dependent homocysteine/selenocysteine methylase
MSPGAPLADFLSELKRRVLVYDGAMGTNLQKRNLTAEDFWGKEGCNELLVLSRPDVIRASTPRFLRPAAMSSRPTASARPASFSPSTVLKPAPAS